MKKFEKAKLPELLRAIGEQCDLILPMNKSGQVNYGVWEEGCTPDLETLKTVKSPKDAFFPQSETLYSVRREGKKLSIAPEELQSRDFVLFGVRACDVQGFKVLDNVFLSAPVDTFYAARRAHGTIVTLACSEPDVSCFCTVFGLDSADPAGDVTMWAVGNDYLWRANTEKGEALTAKLASLLRDTVSGDETALSAAQQEIRSIMDRLPYAHLSLEGWGGDATDAKFSSPIWDTLYKPCLACGTCTFVCPTCQCYDIKDYDTGHGVKRYRCWDSCMYSDFTLMAGGNNRTTQLQRFRQRFMHKLVYYPANNNGMYSCVGCGRCVDKCPSSLNIVKVIKAFAGKGAENA